MFFISIYIKYIVRYRGFESICKIKIEFVRIVKINNKKMKMTIEENQT